MKLIYWSCVRNVSVAGEMLEASSLVACARTIIAVPLMARMLADLPPKLGRRGNHRASRRGTSVELAQRMAHSGRQAGDRVLNIPNWPHCLRLLFCR